MFPRGLVLLDIFINNLDEEIKCTLIKLADGTKLEGAGNTPSGRSERLG